MQNGSASYFNVTDLLVRFVTASVSVSPQPFEEVSRRSSNRSHASWRSCM